jgi:PEP-CTERM motif
MNGKSVQMLVRSVVVIAAVLGAQMATAGSQDEKGSFNERATPHHQSWQGGQSGNFYGHGRGHGNGRPPVTSPVPEPETYAMMLAGLGLMGAIVRRRNKSGRK